MNLKDKTTSEALVQRRGKKVSQAKRVKAQPSTNPRLSYGLTARSAGLNRQEPY